MTKTKVLIAVLYECEMAYTHCMMEYFKWVEYYTNHHSIRCHWKRFALFPFYLNFNEACKYAVENKYDYLFFADADMTAEPILIQQLISHQKEAVGAMFFNRKYPHWPNIWNIKMDNDGNIHHFDAIPKEAVEEQMKKIEIAQKSKLQYSTLTCSDVRGGGYTLFSVPVIKELQNRKNGKYAEHIPGALGVHHGTDIDLCIKISDKYGEVWTDLDPTLNIQHWALLPIGYKNENNN